MKDKNARAMELIEQAERELCDGYAQTDRICYANTERVIEAFKAEKVEARHFAGSNGYGYDDAGRDTFDMVFARAMGAQSAIVRPQIASGTHALALCLFALAAKESTVISATGMPYDTLMSVIGSDKDEEGIETLYTKGVSFLPIELKNDSIDIEGLLSSLASAKNVSLVYIQRSRGYAWREALTIDEIASCVKAVREAGYNGPIMTDNCYGEFTEELEPVSVGVDIIAGSMIKNPGGSFAPTGGYIAGKKKFVDRIQYRITSPGIGVEVGSWQSGYREFYQGLFMAPHVVAQAIKGMMLTACVFEKLGMEVQPCAAAKRSDITQSLKLGSREKLIAFCKAVQSASPVDSHVVPEPWPMPGYADDVIMAAGTFVQGASLELSADGPLREPYTVYMQGGITYEHCRYALLHILSSML